MISANEINVLLEDYLKSSDGQDFLKKQGVSINFYDETQLIHIANNIKNDIINEFLRITSHASEVDAKEYFMGTNVNVGKVRHNKDGDKVVINFSDFSLYRPSLWARPSEKYPTAGYTGGGVKDIFALISGGASGSSKARGYWTYYDGDTKGYTGDEFFTRALLPRRGKPFIEAIIKHYEAVNPGLKITYPPNWR